MLIKYLLFKLSESPYESRVCRLFMDLLMERRLHSEPLPNREVLDRKPFQSIHQHQFMLKPHGGPGGPNPVTMMGLEDRVLEHVGGGSRYFYQNALNENNSVAVLLSIPYSACSATYFHCVFDRVRQLIKERLVCN